MKEKKYFLPYEMCENFSQNFCIRVITKTVLGHAWPRKIMNLNWKFQLKISIANHNCKSQLQISIENLNCKSQLQILIENLNCKS